MKLIVLLLLLSCPFFLGQDFLYALDYQPTIHSMIYQSFLEDPVQSSLNYTETAGIGTEIALSSVEMTKRSIMRYFSHTDQKGIMFRYCPNYPDQDLMIRLMMGTDYHINGDNRYFFLYKGLKLQSQITKDISLKGYWWAGQFRGDKQYYLTSPLLDSFYQPIDNVTYLDNLQGSVLYRKENIEAAIGRGKFQVGNNISGSIILNNAANDYGYYASKLKFGTLSLSYMHGALTPDKSETVHYADHNNAADSSRVDKYIVMHKLDWQPTVSFTAFLGEEIIYGNRSIDLNYLMPHVFWRIIEHNLEDRDNCLVFGGLNWKISRNLSFYQNTVLDEFTQSKVLTNWWGSKYALQAGLSYICSDPKAIAFSEDRFPRYTIEMTVVRPWTYTHFIRWNKFSQDNIALGYPVGSNCINYSAEADYPITDRLFIGINGSYSRQGSIGDKFTDNTSDPLVIPDQCNYSTKWLEGTITNTARLQVMAEWKPLAHHFLRFGTTLSQINRADWTQELSVSYRTEF